MSVYDRQYRCRWNVQHGLPELRDPRSHDTLDSHCALPVCVVLPVAPRLEVVLAMVKAKVLVLATVLVLLVVSVTVMAMGSVLVLVLVLLVHKR